MRIVYAILCFLGLAVANSAGATIPTYVIPGALEGEVRAALPLTNCRSREVDPRMVDCETGPANLDGIPGTYKVTFIGKRLIFTHFFTERKHFAAATHSVTKLMGAPNRSESFEIPVGINGENVKQEENVWGNAELFATVCLYAPGDNRYASVFLLHPAAVPKDMHDAYLPSK